MNTPRLRRGGRMASSSSLFFTCSGTPIVHSILFVTQIPSWSDGLYFLFGVFMP